jgi:hypothetical protein
MKIKTLSRAMRKKTPSLRARRYALCIEPGECEQVDLVRRKVYQVWPDADAELHGQLRVVDESGEDYLFPAEYFQLLTLPTGAERLFQRKRMNTRARPRRVASKTRR